MDPRISRTAALLVAGLVITGATMIPKTAVDEDADAIRAVIESAYIEGLHRNGPREPIEAGFHPQFVMSVHREERIQQVTIQDWMSELPPLGESPDHEVSFDIPQVLRTGDTAVAQVEVMYDGKLIFTDYMGLYRFPQGWRIVNKVFTTHD